MKQVLLVLTFYFLAIKPLAAQANDNTFYRWSASQEVGINIPTTKWRMREITDELVSLREPAAYWNFLNLSYNFSNNWGLNLSYQMAAVGDNKRSSKVANYIEQEYDDTYFILSSSNYLDRQSRFLLENISRFTFGIFYRKKVRKFILRPSLSIGLSSFVSSNHTSMLKEKGSNHIHKLTLSSTSEYRAREYFTVTPSFVISKPISPRFSVYAQTSYYISAYNFAYEIKQENIYDSSSTSRIIPYQGRLHALSCGIGIQYNFRDIARDEK